MNFSTGLTWVLSRSLVVYLVAAAVLYVIADRTRPVIDRMNTVAAWGDYPLHLAQGKVPYDERQLRMAVRYYRLAAEFLSRSDQPLGMLGYCYARLGEKRKAVQYYQNALVKAPDHFWLSYNLGLLYDRQNDPARAVAAFEKIRDQDIQALVRAAVLAPLQRMPDEQRTQLFVRAKEFAFEVQGKSLQMIVAAELKRGRYREALDAAWAAVRHPAVRDPGMFFLYAAAAAYRMGNLNDAVKFCRMSLGKGDYHDWDKTFLVLSMQKLQGDARDEAAVWDRFLQDVLFFPGHGDLILHPWAYYIQPGKELYL